LPAGERGARPRGAEALRSQVLVAAAAQHHLYPMTCLRQALVLQWLLARQAIPTELRIGVRRDGGRLMAHAWLELAGAPLGFAGEAGKGFEPLRRAGERLAPRSDA
jgi:hypothetical protein